MKWALLWVVCQIVSSYRPEIWTPLRPESDDADVPERLTQCRLVDLKSLCQLQLKANDCLHVEDTKATKGRTRFRDQPKECYLRGPMEGVAVIYGGNATAPTVTVSGKASWIISGGLHFHGLRFQVPALRVKNARLTFYNTSAVKDGGEILGGTSNSFGASWIRRNIVLGNAFLPAIFSSFLQWTPCFHMKKNSDGSFQSFSVFQVTEECSSLLGFVMPCCGMLVFLALGPLHWIYMVSQSRKWENRKEYIGFLIAGYNEHCEWWEITVLLRKTFLIGSLVLLPVSYAPMSLVIVTVLIMLAALVGHLMMRPYVDPLMNLLEGGVLTYSMLALILTLYLMSESWTNTNKALVFFVLVSSNAVTCILLLAVFLVIALRRPGKQEAAVTAPIAG